VEKLIVFIIFGIIWAVSKMLEASAKPAAGKGAAPVKPKPNRDLQGELENFLREIKGEMPKPTEDQLIEAERQDRRRKAAEERQAKQSAKQKQSSNRPETVKNKGKVAAKTLKPTLSSEPGDQVSNFPSSSNLGGNNLTPGAMSPSSLNTSNLNTNNLSADLESHVKSYMSDHVKPKINSQVNQYLTPFKDHISGSTGSDTSIMQAQAQAATPREILQMFRNPAGVRQAMIIQEVLKRPSYNRGPEKKASTEPS
jgi:hypothetical protein